MSAHAHHDSTSGMCAACEQQASELRVLDDLMRARHPARPAIAFEPIQLVLDLNRG